MKRQLGGAFVAGLLFAIGLCLSGMTNPAKVIGFLDVFGRWDPSLAFVMIGAVTTHALLYRLATRREAPFFASRFALPTKTSIDVPLVLGSALFGAGWGLAGYCTGPAVASLVSGSSPTLIFAGAMTIGLALYGMLDRSESRGAPSRGTSTADSLVRR